MIVQHPISKQWAATPAIVTEVGPNRDYIVKTPAGRLFRRNRRMLRKRIPVMPGKSIPGPFIQPAPTPSPPPEKNPATTIRRTRGKAKTYINEEPRRSTRKTNCVYLSH